MDKNKDGVVTLEEFVLACQEVGVAFLLSCPLLENCCLYVAFNSQLHLISHWSAVWCLCSPLMYPLIFPAGWDYDEIHAALWKRDVGWRKGQRRQRNSIGLRVSACMWWVHGCNTSGHSSCSRLIRLWHRRSKGDITTVGRFSKSKDWCCRSGLSSPFLSGDKTAWKLSVS